MVSSISIIVSSFLGMLSSTFSLRRRRMYSCRITCNDFTYKIPIIHSFHTCSSFSKLPYCSKNVGSGGITRGATNWSRVHNSVILFCNGVPNLFLSSPKGHTGQKDALAPLHLLQCILKFALLALQSLSFIHHQ